LPVLRNAVNHVYAVTDAMTAKMGQGHTGPFEIHVHQQMLLITAEVLGRIAFGCSFGSIEAAGPEDAVLYEAFRIMLDGFTDRMIPWLGYLWSFLPTPQNKQFDRKLKYFVSVVEEILNSFYKNPKDYENTLLAKLTESDENGTKLSKKEIMDNIKTFLFAGHDTTGSALSWSLYYISTHPEVQEKLREEAKSILSAGSPSFEDLREKMPYTNAFIKEVLRLRPSANFDKIAQMDVVLNGSDGEQYLFKKGSTLMIFPYFTHTSTKYWGEDALEFKPERWLKQKNDDQAMYLNYYYPFSGGHRGCIGMKLALLELVCTTAMMVHKFKVAPTPETKSKPPTLSVRTTLHPSEFTLQFTRI